MEGFKTYRHSDYPEEKRFHDSFCDFDLESASAISLPIKDNGIGAKELLTDREHQIVISTIQWLGSPVGLNYLKSLGYEKKPIPMLDSDRKKIAKICRKNKGWDEMPETEQDNLILKECYKAGFTFSQFFATSGAFLNNILVS